MLEEQCVLEEQCLLEEQCVLEEQRLPVGINITKTGILLLKKRKGVDPVMIEQDTIRLLRECDAGIKMGVEAIDEVLDYVHSDAFRKCLTECRDKHIKLKEEIQGLLDQYHDEGKEPNPMAKGMSWMKTNVKLAMNESDHTIADLITDGCNMGVKSLNKYLNQYKAADEKSKDITKRLSRLEEKLAEDIRQYL